MIQEHTHNHPDEGKNPKKKETLKKKKRRRHKNWTYCTEFNLMKTKKIFDDETKIIKWKVINLTKVLRMAVSASKNYSFVTHSCVVCLFYFDFSLQSFLTHLAVMLKNEIRRDCNDVSGSVNWSYINMNPIPLCLSHSPGQTVHPKMCSFWFTEYIRVSGEGYSVGDLLYFSFLFRN